jgi:rhodanese-related sulfurtransferase
LIWSQILLGIGTALVYPNFISGMAAHTHPLDRSIALSTFRFWRDMGYAIGALLTVLLLTQWSISGVWIFTAILTAFAGLLLWKNWSPSDHPCVDWEAAEPEITAHAALLIDVRSPQEFAAYHHPSAIHLPPDRITPTALQQLGAVRLYTICQAGGGRSAQAAQDIQRMGHPHVAAVCGGVNAIKQRMR